MKFATRQNLGLNRPPAIWFIRRFLDPNAEILLFPKETAIEDAAAAGAVAFHIPGVELHMDKERGTTTLDALIDRYGMRGKDAALDLFSDVIRDASYGVAAGTVKFPESHGLRAIDKGMRAVAPDDRTRIAKLSEVYEALYQWCRSRTEAVPAAS